VLGAHFSEKVSPLFAWRPNEKREGRSLACLLGPRRKEKAALGQAKIDDYFPASGEQFGKQASCQNQVSALAGRKWRQLAAGRPLE